MDLFSSQAISKDDESWNLYRNFYISLEAEIEFDFSESAKSF
jgi:hypothetical protein